MITMILGGLWHGAGWTFIIWGGLHGLYLAINHLWRFIKIRMQFNINCFAKTGKFFSLLFTFLAVLVGWVVFRSESIETASTILLGMIGVNDGNGLELFTLPKAVLGIALLMCIAFFMPNTQQFVDYLYKIDSKFGEVKSNRELNFAWRPTLCWAVGIGALLSVSILFLARESEFLYFQF